MSINLKYLWLRYIPDLEITFAPGQSDPPGLRVLLSTFFGMLYLYIEQI